jgi:sigma-E factor negative regulatory protein RseB
MKPIFQLPVMIALGLSAGYSCADQLQQSVEKGLSQETIPQPNQTPSANTLTQGLSAAQWLEKMDTAQRELSYRGTFIYMRGAQFETVEVAHQFVDGQQRRRLTSISGPEREIIHSDDEVICRHLPDSVFDLDHDLPVGPFSSVFSKILSSNHAMYQITMRGTGRIARRPAVKIRITPQHEDRYGYQIWLDQETGLLLRSDLVNRGRVLELFQFADIEVGQELDASIFVATMNGEAQSHSLVQRTPRLALSGKPKNWKVSWVPNGFKAVKPHNGSGMVFSDGIANLSVFVEQSINTSLGDMHTSVGGTVVLTRQIKGSSQQITVVGEVPVSTAQKIAESIEPVIY